MPVAAFLAATVSDLATYLTTSAQLAWAFPDPSGGVLGSFAKFAGVFALTQLPLAVVEGVLTMLVVQSLLAHGRADLAATGLLEDDKTPAVAFRKVAVAGGLAVLVVVAAAVLVSTGVLGFGGSDDKAQARHRDAEAGLHAVVPNRCGGRGAAAWRACSSRSRPRSA